MIVLHHSQMTEILARLPVLNSLELDHGVSFFFVLSGFILRYNYQSLTGVAEKYNFLVSRIARILPAHLFFLGLFLLNQRHGWLVSPYLERLLLQAVLLQSWVPIKETYFAFNGVAWSISTELFFYVVFVLLVNRMKQFWPLFLLLAGAFILALAYVCIRLGLPDFATAPPNSLSAHGLLYIFPPTRLLEFFFGIAVFEVRQYVYPILIRLKTLGATVLEVLTLIILLLSMANAHHLTGFIVNLTSPVVAEYLGHTSSFPCFGLIVFFFSFERGWCSRLLQLRLLVFLGEISYSLYLCHAMTYNYFISEGWLAASFGLKQVVFWIVILGLSTAVYLLVEKPLRKFLVGRFRMETVARVAV